ncbi:MAG TPA: hypothetical protein VI423_10895 [Paenisporosarcina sp.]|nr:hypothetical protein [Paenisporosarcina sp.]
MLIQLYGGLTIDPARYPKTLAIAIIAGIDKRQQQLCGVFHGRNFPYRDLEGQIVPMVQEEDEHGLMVYQIDRKPEGGANKYLRWYYVATCSVEAVYARYTKSYEIVLSESPDGWDVLINDGHRPITICLPDYGDI